MITRDQVAVMAKNLNANETTVFREYLQLLFLSRLYTFPESKAVFFKGGTALHVIFQAPRFSEDLDFTVNLAKTAFNRLIERVFRKFSPEEGISFKKKNSVAGRKYLLTAGKNVLPYEVFVSLDFSFREKVFDPQKSPVKTEYPVLFDSYVYHLSKEEIAAEKIRAIMTRKKGRDWYDLWFLLNRNVGLDNKLVNEKLKYYGLNLKNKQAILTKLNEVSSRDFVLDMRPFVPISEREKLPEFFNYLQDYLRNNL